MSAVMNTRRCPLAAGTIGNSNPRCGLYVSNPSSTPARIGRSMSMSSAPPKSAALRNPFWPAMKLASTAGKAAARKYPARSPTIPRRQDKYAQNVESKKMIWAGTKDIFASNAATGRNVGG
jgi:hypothetical protein